MLGCEANQSSYGTNQPANLIPLDSLIAVLVDLHLTDASSKQNFFPNNNHTPEQYKQYKAILQLHQISKNRFDSTIHYYCGHGERFEELYNQVIADLEQKEKELQMEQKEEQN